MEHWLAYFMDGNEQVREVASAAEAMGFTGIALVDHVALPENFGSVHPSGERQVEPDSLFSDPFITAATMAAVTTTLRFMTYIYLLPMRDPFSVAKQVTTLAMQTGYRFSLGIGAGWNAEEFALLGQDFATRGRRMDEMIQVMRGFWEHGTFEHHGEFYDFARACQYPAPGQRIPIWVGGTSPAALRRAARNDGWLGMMASTVDAKRMLETTERERERLGAEGPFQRLIVPSSDAQHRELEELGFNAFLAWCWNSLDRRSAPLQYKLDTMSSYAAKHIGRR
jgi:probable F420-dependent oxidoreductase